MESFLKKVCLSVLALCLVVSLMKMVGYLLSTPEERAYEHYLATFPAGEIGKGWTIMDAEWHETPSGKCMMDYPGYITLDKIISKEELVFHYTPSRYSKREHECPVGTRVKGTAEWFQDLIARHGGGPG